MICIIGLHELNHLSKKQNQKSKSERVEAAETNRHLGDILEDILALSRHDRFPSNVIWITSIQLTNRQTNKQTN